jgi:hypothetical protein
MRCGSPGTAEIWMSTPVWLWPIYCWHVVSSLQRARTILAGVDVSLSSYRIASHRYANARAIDRIYFKEIS